MICRNCEHYREDDMRYMTGHCAVNQDKVFREDSCKLDYTAADAYYDHNADKAKAVGRKIVTKDGLKMYTDKELDKMQGPVMTYSPDDFMDPRAFKGLSKDQQLSYIRHVFKDRPEMRATEFARLFDLPDVKVRAMCREAGVKLYQGGSRTGEPREEKSERLPKASIQCVVFTAPGAVAGNYVKALKLEGMLRVTVEVLNEGDNAD